MRRCQSPGVLSLAQLSLGVLFHVASRSCRTEERVGALVSHASRKAHIFVFLPSLAFAMYERQARSSTDEGTFIEWR